MNLEVVGLAKRFDDAAGVGHAALGGVDLVVAPREVVALVGTSGCGKSTLLRIVCGLEAPSSGHVRLGARKVEAPTPEVAMVFQEPRLMPWLTVRENVRLALIGLARDEQDARIDEALEKVGLAEFKGALPRQLSGGMAQRAAIARALVRQPKVMLLDEPFSALDSFTRLRLQDHLIALWQAGPFTLVFVTHDVEEAAMLADRVIVMRGQPGRIHREIVIDLLRPRLRATGRVQALKDEIVAALDLS